MRVSASAVFITASLQFSVSSIATLGMTAHHFLENRRQRLRPDLISLEAEMQRVGHDLLRERSIRSQEPIADIQKPHAIAVLEFRQRAVYLSDLCAIRISGLSAPREDAHQHKSGFGKLLADSLRHANHAATNLIRGAANVVRSDQ